MVAPTLETIPNVFDDDDDDEDASLTPDSVPEGLPSAVFAPRSLHWGGDPPAAPGSLPAREGLHLLDILPIGIVLFDLDQQIRYANPAHRALLGRDIVECGGIEPWLRGACLDDSSAADTIHQWREHLWQKQLPRVFSLKTADDLLREIEFQPRLLDDGDLLLTIRDVTESRQIEDALRLTDAKFRAVFGRVDRPIALIDRTGRFIETNAAFEKLLGHQPGGLRRIGIAECVALGDLERLRQVLEGLRDSQISMQQGMIADATLLLRLRPREGALLAARISLAAAVGPQGRSLFTALIVEDEGGRVGDRALLEAIPDVILAMDRHGRIEEAIPAPAADWVGIQPDPGWVGRNVADCWPGFAERAAAKVTGTIDRGEPVLLRFSEPSPMDPERLVAYSVRLAPVAGDRAVATVTDSSADAAMLESLARQTAVYRHLEECVILANLRGRILDWNPAASRGFGHEVAEVRDRGLAVLYAKPGAEADFNRELSRALTETGRWERRGAFYRADGTEGRCEASFVPVMDGGTPRSLLGIHREISADEKTPAPAPAPPWRGWLEAIGSLVALDAQSPRLPLRIQGWLRAAALVPDEGPVVLAEYTRRLMADLLRATVGGRQAPVRFEFRAEEGLTADRSTAVAFGMLVSELTLPLMFNSQPVEPQPAMLLRSYEGHLLWLLRVPESTTATVSLPVLRRLAELLRGRVTSSKSPPSIEWAVRFPAEANA